MKNSFIEVEAESSEPWKSEVMAQVVQCRCDSHVGVSRNRDYSKLGCFLHIHEFRKSYFLQNGDSIESMLSYSKIATILGLLHCLN